MKRKIHSALAVAGVLSFTIAGAQTLENIGPVPEHIDSKYIKIKQAQAERTAFKAGGNTLFYEDFENGLAGNNIFGNWTRAGQDSAIWEHDFDGSSGQYWGNRDSLMSTTAANGWMMFDGDGSNPGPPSGFLNREGYLISPVMDLTGYPFVHLEFEQYFRFCCSYLFRLKVGVSTDGFQSFNEFIVSDPYARNEDSPNPHVQRLSISSALVGGDLSNVQIRFQWEGLDLDPNSQGTSHYFWMVDDVAIVESENNDMALTNAEYSDFAGTGELEYYIYPYSQLRPITFKGWLLNDGVNDQSNVVMDISVNGGGAYSGTTTPLDIIMNEKDSVLGTTTFTPPASDEMYMVEYSVTQDSLDDNPANNDTISSFMVQEFIFARDRGVSDGSTDNQGEAFELCNIFDITADADLTSIDVAIDDGSTIGAIFDGTIVDANLDPVEETYFEYEVEASDLNGIGDSNFKQLALEFPLTVFAGESYGVCLRHFGGTDTIAVATSGNSYPQTSFILDVPTATWFFTTETPMIRMNFDPDVIIPGIEELSSAGLSLLGAFPNPTSEGTVVRFELEESKEITFEVHDMTGQLVIQQDLGQLAQGEQKVAVDTRNLVDGVYFYSLISPETRLTERLVVIK